MHTKTIIALSVLLIAVFGLGYTLRGCGAAPQLQVSGNGQQEQAPVKFWTCSMHPQIRKPGPGLCPICAMDLVPVSEDTGAGQGGPRELTLSPLAIKLAEIQTAPVEKKPVSSEVGRIRLDGKVEYDESRLAYITAWVPGRVEKLFVDFTGVSVRKGDPLVSLYSPELITAQQELLLGLKMLKDSPPRLMESTLKNVEATREKLRLWGLTEEQIRAIEDKGRVSERVTIYSPISGAVIHKNGFEGIYVETGTRIYTIADLSTVWVLLDAYEADLAWIRYGQDVEFETRAYPGETFKGAIAFIDPMLNEETRSVKVRVNVPNPDGRLKPGIFVSARVFTGYAADQTTAEQALLVIPATAPLITGKRAVVYVPVSGKQGAFEGREIVLGPRIGDYYVVKAGLEEGEAVVVNGNFKIDSALQILAKPSMMNPEGVPVLGQHARHGADQVPPATQQAEAFAAPIVFRRQIDELVAAYYLIHQALSSDRFSGAVEGAGAFLNRLDAVDMGQLKSRAHAAWMAAHKQARRSASALASAPDIDTARAKFDGLSDTLYMILQQFGTSGELPVYRFHCPMAKGNQGAYWLQRSTEVENPYFGSSMYRCGTKVETLSSGLNGGQVEGHVHER